MKGRQPLTREAANAADELCVAKLHSADVHEHSLFSQSAGSRSAGSKLQQALPSFEEFNNSLACISDTCAAQHGRYAVLVFTDAHAQAPLLSTQLHYALMVFTLRLRRVSKAQRQCTQQQPRLACRRHLMRGFTRPAIGENQALRLPKTL